MSIVYVVEHEQPPFLATAQPIVHQFENVCFGFLPPKDLDAVSYLAIALLKPRCIAGVHPEHPRFCRPVARAVGMLNSELRLASRCQRTALASASS